MAGAPIYHFARPDDWRAAQGRGEYRTADLASEGFIHCATEAQIAGVIERHLRGTGPRIKLSIDPQALGNTLHYDWSEASQDLYPHVYGPIPLDAVLAVEAFNPDAEHAMP